MINLNDIAHELKSKLYLYTNLVSKEKNIENINIVNKDVSLTITNHSASPTEDAITIKDIKYKYPIKTITKQPKSINTNRFLVEMATPNHPIVAELRTVELKNITTDIAYNGVFTLEQIISPTEFVLQTTNNINIAQISNEGSVLYALSDSREIMNALNGYKKMTIIDNNTLKYSLNDIGDKFTPVINEIDFTNAKAGLTQQVFIINQNTVLKDLLASLDKDIYTIFISFVSDNGSTSNGISNVSPDVTNTTTGGMINKRDYFFDIIIYSKKLPNVESDYLKKEALFYQELPEVQFAIWQAINRSAFVIPFVSNYGFTFPPVLLNIAEGMEDDRSNYKSCVMSWKISYHITPSDIVPLAVTTKIQSIDFNNTSNNQNIIHGHYEK